MLGRVNAAAIGRAQHHRAGQAPARARSEARGVVGELIDRRIDEAGELNLGDGAKALRRKTGRDPGNADLRERRIEDALRAEAREQPVGGAKYATVGADILAEHDHPRIGAHRARQREIDRLHQIHLNHFPLRRSATVPRAVRPDRRAPARR